MRAPSNTSADEFKPAWWLRSAHLQTLWPTLFRHHRGPAFVRERVELDDGDFVDLDIAGKHHPRTVLLLHGLEGSSKSPYMRGMASALESEGWRVVVLHFRGCSGEPNRLPRTYHSGDTADLGFVITLIRERYGTQPLTAVGYSLGANVLLKHLGESGLDSGLDAAAAICAPMVLQVCAKRLQQGFSRFYQWWLLRSLRHKLRRKTWPEPAPLDLTRLDTHNSFRAFDHAVTAPLHGFESADDYYQRVSGRQFVPRIQTSTLIIHSSDDPFMTDAVLPAPSECGPQVQIEVCSHGGHVGFITGVAPFFAHYWLETRVPRYFEQSVAERN